MFVHNLNPVLFSIGGFELRYYALMYIIGIVFAYLFLTRWHKPKDFTREQISDLLFYIVLGIIVGGRIFYCLIYNPAYYFANPAEIIMIWRGGLSFHGGFATVLLFGWLYCRKHKLSFLRFADVIILPVPIAIALGRLGNFINGELWGRPTGLPWGFLFPAAPDKGTIARHPSQLYEMLKNIVLFIGLFFLSKKKFKDGFLLFSFFLFYGVLRFLVEFVREPEIVAAGLTMGQWLTIPLIIIGAVGIWKKWG